MKNRLESLLRWQKRPSKVTRRAMLRGTGGILLGLPFLPSLMSAARAEASDIPCRLISFYTANGFDPVTRPRSSELAGTSLSPLAPFRDQVTTLGGISQESRKLDPYQGDGAHYIGWGHCSTAVDVVAGNDGRVAGGISFDQAAGSVISEDWQTNVLVQGGPSWLGSGMAAFSSNYDPKAVWQTLFSGFSVDPSNENMAELEAQRRMQERSVLDYSLESVQELRCQLGVEDRRRLDAHLSGIRQLELRVDGMPSTTDLSACTIPNEPRKYEWPEVRDNSAALYREWAEIKIELTVMAMACDRVRAASIGLGSPANGHVPADLGINETHHELSHSEEPTDRGYIRQIDEYNATQFALLLRRLSEVDAGEGVSLLDQSALLWLSEGGGATAHDADAVELVVAGSAGGLRHGQHLQYDGFAHNNILLEVFNAVVADEDKLACFGNQEVCGDGVPELRS